MASFMFIRVYEGLEVVLYEKPSEDKRTSVFGGQRITNKKIKYAS